jgi:hypothetical protein
VSGALRRFDNDTFSVLVLAHALKGDLSHQAVTRPRLELDLDLQRRLGPMGLATGFRIAAVLERAAFAGTNLTGRVTGEESILETAHKAVGC